MKILILFLDMVRTDHLQLYAPDRQETSLDRFLKKLGGTLYNKCYSPAPDTPRSTACLLTGLYPSNNGCDTRIKWPKYFIKDGISTIFDNLYERGFEIDLCHNLNEMETGFIRVKDETKINYFDDLDSFFANASCSDNSVSFIGYPDLHTAIFDYHSTELSLKKGWNILQLFFDKYISRDYIDNFDYVFVYSDHGMGLAAEMHNMKTKLELLNDGRSRILTFVHRKGDAGITIDNRLASIVDIYSTIEKLTGGYDMRDGYDLIEEPKRTVVHVEDHEDFIVTPEVMVKQWRVITPNSDVRTNLKETINERNEAVDLESVLPVLSVLSPKILDLKKQYEIWDHYKVMCKNQNNYFVGVPRLSESKQKLISFFVFIRYFSINKLLSKASK